MNFFRRKEEEIHYEAIGFRHYSKEEENKEDQMFKGEVVKMWEEMFGIKLWQALLLGLIVGGSALVGVLFFIKWIFFA